MDTLSTKILNRINFYTRLNEMGKENCKKENDGLERTFLEKLNLSHGGTSLRHSKKAV